MKILVSILAVAAFAVAAPAASADYTLTADPNTLFVGPGDEPFIAIKYTAVCGDFCQDTQTVTSSDGTAFQDTSGICNVVADTGSTSFLCDELPNTQVTGTPGADSVGGTCFGSASRLVFDGLGGNDEVSAGNCRKGDVELGDGNDRSIAGGVTTGGAGNDIIAGSDDLDILDGGDGRDTVDGRGEADVVTGGAGRDLLIGGAGHDNIQGGADIDFASFEDHSLAVTASLDNVANDGSFGENDLIAADVEGIIGGAGDDTLNGNAGPNDIDGGDGGDVINPGGGPDFVDGGTGNDRINARDGVQDRIQCGEGNDQAVVDAFDTVIACEDIQASRELMPDVDADGVPAPADCDDRDGRRRPGFIDKPGNRLDEDCSGRDQPFFRILSPIQSLFQVDGRRTRVLRLRVLGVPQGGRIELRCRGRGCFRGVRRFNAPRGAESRNIRRPLRRRVLRAGARLEVRILDADSIGKVQRFTMRSRSRLPASQRRCLVPGQRRPGRCPRL
jgi:RTX calcium-binding nonapeptide repeat (4 copies)